MGRGALFAAFQVSSAVLLLAAASSSFQAGPGLLKALARGGGGVGILPAVLSSRNRYHTPYWGVAAFLAAAAILVVAAGGQEQRLVLFYAVAVFIAFWCGLASMTRLFLRARRRWLAVVSVSGALAVGVTLATDAARGYPIVSFAAACLIAAIFYSMWVRAGRPRGVAQAEQIAEAEDDPAVVRNKQARPVDQCRASGERRALRPGRVHHRPAVIAHSSSVGASAARSDMPVPLSKSSTRASSAIRRSNAAQPAASDCSST